MNQQELVNYLERIYPLDLTEEFDNTGLLIGARNREIQKVMTCLTITAETIDEARKKKADLIVSHHPFPFHAGKRWTTDTPNGRMLLALMEAKIAVFSPHTAHDSAFFGINEQLAEMLDLMNIAPLIPSRVIANENMLDDLSNVGGDLIRRIGQPLGSGRIGKLKKAVSLKELAKKILHLLHRDSLQIVGPDNKKIQIIAIGCGAAGTFIEEAARQKADLLLLGETHFHPCLEAQALELALILPGHYATERFAMETMARRIAHRFPDLKIWASKDEREPIRFFTGS
ncbi:MAG: Nif3-like dinuclear metal center hexameric protein [Planctomycetia bacterium]|nr:Nif3-like dinuclear metal center hexameric protein [Planctomycetia bacterium]